MRRTFTLFITLASLLVYGCGGSNHERARESVGARTGTISDNPAHRDSDSDADIFYLVMLGDSITAGFGLPANEALPVALEAALRRQGHAIRIINAGVSGDTAEDGARRFDWSVDPRADAVLIALGGNDLLQGVSPAKTRRHLVAMIKTARARNLTILLAGMNAPGNYGAEFQSAFDQIFPELAARYKLALYPFLLDGVAGEAHLNQPDGIHPNRQGVAILVEGLAPFIASAMEP